MTRSHCVQCAVWDRSSDVSSEAPDLGASWILLNIAHMRTFAGGDHTDPLRPLARSLGEATTFEEKAAALAAYAGEHEALGVRISHLYCTHPDTASGQRKCRGSVPQNCSPNLAASPAAVTLTAITPTPPQHVASVARRETRLLHMGIDPHALSPHTFRCPNTHSGTSGVTLPEQTNGNTRLFAHVRPLLV